MELHSRTSRDALVSARCIDQSGIHNSPLETADVAADAMSGVQARYQFERFRFSCYGSSFGLQATFTVQWTW